MEFVAVAVWVCRFTPLLLGKGIAGDRWEMHRKYTGNTEEKLQKLILERVPGSSVR